MRKEGKAISTNADSNGVSRRSLLGLAGFGVLAGAAGGAGLATLSREGASPRLGTESVPFYGLHQAGIATPVQDRLHFATFDLTTRSRDRVVRLLRAWTDAAVRMGHGAEIGTGAFGGQPQGPPDDTGEALGLPPTRLTVTVGFGPNFFAPLGLADHRPEALTELPHFPGENLDPTRCGGDIAVQACADDPQVAVHAVRNLARIGFGTVGLRWSQLGFGKTSSTTAQEQTPRNLMGFKDGTRNIDGGDEAALREHVWAQPADGPAWMVGGSYLVARRIRMHIETWDRTSLAEQQDIIGRTKGEGAPIGASQERDPVTLAALKPDSHVRLAHSDAHGGVRLLRRGYSFVDGSDGLGRLDAGLFFLAYQRDPRRQFVPIQRALAAEDTLNEYIQHVGSGVFAVPPGVPAEGGFWGEALFR